jgi:hypothetical protein
MLVSLRNHVSLMGPIVVVVVVVVVVAGIVSHAVCVVVVVVQFVVVRSLEHDAPSPPTSKSTGPPAT